MILLLIRHGPAGERSEWARTGNPDSERPLTVEGREAMRLAAPALRGLVGKLDVLATSPFTRAYQTADIVAGAYDAIPLTVVDPLASGGDRRALLNWLREQTPGITVALVGHNPDLEDLAAWLLAGQDDGFIKLKKGGAAMIKFKGTPAPGEGVLHWLMQPGQLRGMVKRATRDARRATPPGGSDLGGA
jgi:phosphohistidine phosphatase